MNQTQSKPIALFRTKASILTAKDLGNVRIANEVLQDPIFVAAKMTDLLGFTAVEGSDYTVVSVRSIKDPKAFFELAFGQREN